MAQEHYFYHVISRLSEDDLRILEALQKSEATIPFKAITKSILQGQVNLTDALFRKSLNRLSCSLLIETVVGSKQHPLYITSFGVMAYQRAITPNYIRR